MALGKEPYKHLYAADLTALRDLSVMAERVYVHLACGERSSACCVASCDPEHLRYSVRARRTSEVMDALTELEAAGWLVLDLAAKQAWLPVQAKRTRPVDEPTAKGWRNDLSRFKVSLATLQALAFIDSLTVAPSKGRQRPTQPNNSISNSNSIPIPIGIGAPAVAVDPKPKRAKPERPTLDEAVAYFQEQDSTAAEATAFCDHHEARGWVIGRTAMKDWQAAARTWIRNAAKWAAQGSRYAKPQAPGKLTGQYEVFSEAEMVKARKQMEEDTTPW